MPTESSDDTKQSAFCPQPAHGTDSNGNPCYGHCRKVEAHPNEPHTCRACGEDFGNG